MRYEIKYRPSYSMLVVKLEQGEKIAAESSAMTYMSPNIEVYTRRREKHSWKPRPKTSGPPIFLGKRLHSIEGTGRSRLRLGSRR